MMIADRVAALDTSLFTGIESQTSEPDRQSLLALHAVIGEHGPFDYLEIGSHLGGSLQALVADPRSIVSIDTRPLLQPDDRGDDAAYSEQHRADAGAAFRAARCRPRQGPDVRARDRPAPASRRSPPTALSPSTTAMS
jgi:hypothetical protein